MINYRRLLERAGEGDSEALTRQLRDRRFDRPSGAPLLAENRLTQAQIDRMVERYRERYIKYRAEVIGRTEALRAVHAGNDEGYRQAIDGGAIDLEELQRTWKSRHKMSVRRDSHRLPEGKCAALMRPFVVGGAQLRYPGDSQGRQGRRYSVVAPWRHVWLRSMLHKPITDLATRAAGKGIVAHRRLS